MSTDTIGNKLPSEIENINTENLGLALSVNTFVATCELAKGNGATVIYSKKNKKADIITVFGELKTVKHL